MRGALTRILVTTDAVGGVWRYSLELCAAWRASGVGVILAGLGPSPDESQRREAAALPGLVLLDTGLDLDWTARNAESLEATAERLAEFARVFDVDSVHLHAPALIGNASWHVPVVAMIHSCLLTWWQAMRKEPLPVEFVCRIEATARGLRRADAVTAPSAAFAAAVRNAYRLGRTMTVIHNGRHPILLPAAMRSAGVFASGRFWDDAKNAAGLDAAARLIAGPVSAAGETRAPDGRRVQFDHVRHLGVLDDAELAKHLAANTVFAGLSLYEPFGLSVLEAAQAGMALVLSDIPVFRELWYDAAIFVDARDAHAVADGLAAALHDPQPMARRARVRSLAYERDRMALKTLRVHARLCGAAVAV
jgi:glycosyltransferase involved in cell wall biosynthesis